MKLTVSGAIDVGYIVREALDTLDLSGVGADGDSEYDLEEVAVTVTGDAFEVTLDVLHRAGKFASRDDVAEIVVAALNEIEGVEVDGA